MTRLARIGLAVALGMPIALALIFIGGLLSNAATVVARGHAGVPVSSIGLQLVSTSVQLLAPGLGLWAGWVLTRPGEPSSE